MPKPIISRPLGVLALAVSLALPVQAETLSGAYLAARQADYGNDFRAIVEFGSRALAQDPGNLELMEALVVAHVDLGNYDQAVPIARHLLSLDPTGQIAGLVMLGDALQREDWQGVLDILETGTSVGDMMDSMISAWVHMGLGQMSQALEIFETLAGENGSDAFALYHRALALALAGDYETAAHVLSGKEGVLQLTRGGVIAYAQVLSQLERSADAIEMIDTVFPAGGDDEVQALRADLAVGKPIAFTAIKSPRDGLAEVFLAVAESLAGGVDGGLVLLYSRTAEHLNPALSPAILLSASLLESMQRYELAVETYSRIKPADGSYMRAALGRAEALRASGKQDEAIGALRALGEVFPDRPQVHVALGDALRYEERYGEATPAYDAAIALYDKPFLGQWVVYFARGITHEREDRWPQAEADFRKALELNPEQPSVLNYLGYSFVEMGENLDEALDMIERAVVAKPGDGYIIDSLGWVYYQIGRYNAAVGQMEKAVELLPVDPIVNDHLGDVYWAVGRQLEAEFQWRRAMSFEPEEEDADRIRRKIEIGLDAVLEEEGAPPLVRSDEDS